MDYFIYSENTNLDQLHWVFWHWTRQPQENDELIPLNSGVPPRQDHQCWNDCLRESFVEKIILEYFSPLNSYWYVEH